MKEKIKSILNITQVISFCGMSIVGFLGVIYEILGYAKFQQMMSAVEIDKGFEFFWIFGLIMLVVSGGTYFIRTKILSDGRSTK